MAINPSPKVAGLLVSAMWKHAGDETGAVMNSHVYRYFCIHYLLESFREGLCNHRRWFVCLSVCLSVCYHDN